MTTWFLIAAVVLILLNGFFVAIEFALLAARRSTVEPLAEESKRARIALDAMVDLNRQLSGAQLGITMASLALGYVAEPAIEKLLEPLLHRFHLSHSVEHALSVAIALAIVAFFHMVIGEMVPKNLALAGAERTAFWLAPMHRRFVWLLSPVIWLLNNLSVAIVKAFGVEPSDELSTAHTPQELASMVDASVGEGLIGEFSHGLLSGALELRSRPISSVMVPWDKVETIRSSMTVVEIEASVVKSGHSRFPVVTTQGLVEGYVHNKDMLRVPRTVRNAPLARHRINPMVVLRPTRTLSEALLAMRRSQSHIALVSEDGKPVGIVALEDIVEQVVGDIRDEADVDREAGATN